MEKNVVLFVDDEDQILTTIKQVVSTEDFTALFTNSAAEALKLMEIYEVSVLVTDMMMPEMDGLSLLKEAKLLYPRTIRVILAGHTQLSEILDGMNQGDIFRFIRKPWNMEADLLSTVQQGIEYYNLRRDKQELERSLHQKNRAYKNMLQTLEGKCFNKQGNVVDLTKILFIIIDGLEKEFAANSKGLLKLQLVRSITDDYFKTIPVVPEEFSVQDIVKPLQKLLAENNDDERYQIKVDHTSIKCFGNFRTFIMILLSVAKILCQLGGTRTFEHLITSHVYQEKGVVRISNVLKFGYVDGVEIVIDAQELLSNDNLEFYTGLLAQIGQPYDIDIAYTHINQNTSLIAISTEFTLG